MDTNMTRRNALTLIAGGLATMTARPSGTAAAPAAPLVGFLMVIRPEGSGPCREVEVKERSDGSYLVRPVRSGPSPWKDR